MELEQQAIDRIVRWRFEGYWTRTGQAALVAPLAWLVTHSVFVPIWFAVAVTLSTVDAMLFKRLHGRMNDRRLRAVALTVLGLSTAAFASIGPLMLTHRSPVTLAGAALILCAINLNNAVMTRGWTLVTRISIGASSFMIVIAAPIAAAVLGYRLSPTDAMVLEAGAVAYVAFIGLLVSTLNREGNALHRALAGLEHQRDFVREAKEDAERARARWNMLFDQSPLPQLCFDASRLYDVLRPHVEAGETRLGDVLLGSFSDVSKAVNVVRLTEANQAAEALFGVSTFDRGVSPRHFDAGFLPGFCESLNAMRPDGALPPFESKVLRPDGTPVDVAVHFRTVPGEERPWSTCLTSFVDMTEVRRAAQAQREAVEAAETANLAKSEFLAIMSHEIRTPLNGVLGMAQAMARDPLSRRQRERLDVVGQSGAALLAILNDILDLSKIEAGKLELESASFDLQQLAQGAYSAFADVAARKGLEFSLDVAAEARGAYRGDPVRVRQVLFNLTANAVKFTAVGSVRLEVTPGHLGVRFAVSDTGVGVPADRIERLFDKFVQADTSTTREFGGTGLGLAICRELCAAMGGEIRAESQVGRGSCFIVDLPLERAADFREASAQAAAPDFAERSLRILAAEDNAVNQLVLKTLLGQAGLEAVVVGNGEEAVAAWEQGDWDLILMDVQMPVMDGPTATRIIRRREAESGRAATPVIALTANAMTHQADAYRAAGMNGFVAKPIEVTQLFEAIAAAVRREGPTASAAA
ncbi:MAG: ATP-binding protein [Caulobacterales bacterium]